MSWNYRIVEYADGNGYGVHEVHYDDAGVEVAMGANPAAFVGETPEEVRAAIARAHTDTARRPVFEPPAEWAEEIEHG